MLIQERAGMLKCEYQLPRILTIYLTDPALLTDLVTGERLI